MFVALFFVFNKNYEQSSLQTMTFESSSWANLSSDLRIKKSQMSDQYKRYGDCLPPNQDDPWYWLIVTDIKLYVMFAESVVTDEPLCSKICVYVYVLFPINYFNFYIWI